MALPQAIQRQVNEAAAAEAAIAQSLQQPTETVVTDPSQLTSANTESSAVQLPAENPPPAPAPQPSEDWQQKYKSLQGMFAQKTGELQAQTKAYESQMARMQQQLDALMQNRKQDEAKEKAVIDPKDIENFGADMIEMVQRYAEQVFRSMDGRISAIEKQLNGVSNRTEATLEQQFYAALGGLVPEWEQINQDERWLTWLAEVDPVYGAQRQAALDSARQALDVQRVANVFRAFKATLPVQKPQESLASQVAPSGAASSPPVQQVAPSAQLLSTKFVEKFYNDYAKGRYAGREEEANRLIAEIDRAAAEGRIR